AALRWSSDNARILLGVKEQSDDPAFGRDTTQDANVDVWHWRDPEPQSVQLVRLQQERRSTYPAVFHVASRSVRALGDSAMRTVTPTRALDAGIGRLDAPYRGEVAWGGSRADYYRVNTVTGE